MTKYDPNHVSQAEVNSAQDWIRKNGYDKMLSALQLLAMCRKHQCGFNALRKKILDNSNPNINNKAEEEENGKVSPPGRVERGEETGS